MSCHQRFTNGSDCCRGNGMKGVRSDRYHAKMKSCEGHVLSIDEVNAE